MESSYADFHAVNSILYLTSIQSWYMDCRRSAIVSGLLMPLLLSMCGRNIFVIVSTPAFVMLLSNFIEYSFHPYYTTLLFLMAMMTPRLLPAYTKLVLDETRGLYRDLSAQLGIDTRKSIGTGILLLSLLFHLLSLLTTSSWRDLLAITCCYFVLHNYIYSEGDYRTLLIIGISGVTFSIDLLEVLGYSSLLFPRSASALRDLYHEAFQCPKAILAVVKLFLDVIGFYVKGKLSSQTLICDGAERKVLLRHGDISELVTIPSVSGRYRILFSREICEEISRVDWQRACEQKVERSPFVQTIRGRTTYIPCRMCDYPDIESIVFGIEDSNDSIQIPVIRNGLLHLDTYIELFERELFAEPTAEAYD